MMQIVKLLITRQVYFIANLQFYQMSDININSIQSLVNKHHPTLQLMHNHAIAQSHRIARQVYNRQNRNIAQFIREQRIFNKKMAQKPLFFTNNYNVPQRKRFGVTLRYQENERLELSFERNSPVEREEIVTEANKVKNSISDMDSKGQTFISSKKSFLKSSNLSYFKLQARNKANDRNLSIPLHNRKKTLTISSPRSSQSPNFIDSPQKPKSNTRRRVMTQIQPVQDSHNYSNSRQKTSQDQTYGSNNPLILMNKQRMTKFIKNLHKLEWMADFLQGKPQEAQQSEQFKQHLRNFHYDPDSPISENKLNYMVARRYGLLSFYLEDHYVKKMKQLQEHQTAAKKQRFASHKDYPILEMASKRSILTLFHKDIEDRPIKFLQRQAPIIHQEKISFSLPFAEFISQRQTKASIYRLVRMSTNSYLKIAFGLYDKNKNGIIDEDDLLQAVSLTRKMPHLQSDLLVLCNTFNTPRLSVIRNKQKTIGIGEREKSQRGKLSFIQSIKPIEQIQFQSRGQSEEDRSKNHKTTTFSLDKFYIFLKNKKDQNKQLSNGPKQANISFTFAAFCRAFNGHRPAILTDLFQFLLGAQKEDFVDTTDIVSIKPSGRFDNKSTQKEQTLEEKWNNRIKNTNNIVMKLIGDAKNL